jgi:hypothetical protein
MSETQGPTPPSDQSNATAAQRQRVLACILCQQRKVKCDRRFPCANCVKANAQCVPAALLQKQRRKRFAERELLDRLRHYEALLKENGIEFEPLHPSGSGKVCSTSKEVKVKTEPVHEPKYAALCSLINCS